MRFGRLLAKLGLVVAVVAAPIAASADEALDRITKAGVVRIAVPDNFPPFGDLGSDAKPQGYDIDVAALVAEGLKVKPEMVPAASGDRIPALTDGKVDLIVSSLGKDAEREKLIDFSVAYAPFYSAVFGPEELQVAKPEDLADKTIGVTRGTIEDGALTKLAPASATIKRFEDNGETEAAFMFKQTQLIATGSVVAAQSLASGRLTKAMFKFLLRNSPCYVGVGKNEPDLLARVNAIIAASRNDGSLDKIAQRWLKAPLGDPEHPNIASAK
jgi:polar amino acid transport system substrate-binding protein